MSGSSANLLPKAFPAAEFVDGEPMLRRVRRGQEPEEVEAIRASVRVAEEALAAATAALVPGVTERQLTAIFMEAMAAAGVTTPSRTGRGLDTSRQIRGVAPTATRRCSPETWWPSRPASSSGATPGRWAGPTRCARGVTSTPSWPSAPAPSGRGCSTPAGVGAPLPISSPPRRHRCPEPPMPVARGLGLGFDLPLVTRALPLTAGEQHIEAGMVFALTGYVWKEGVGALYVQEPIVTTESGPVSLSTNAVARTKEPDDVSAADVPPAEEIILYEKDPVTRIATITLNRPDQLNIPTIAARRRYADLIFRASIDDDVKVLVVRGIGDHLGPEPIWTS